MAETDSKIACQKQQFSLPEGLHYLNCAYMSPLARPVEAAGVAGLQRKRVPSAIEPHHFFEDSDRARQLFGALIGASPERIALIPAASYGLSTVARNLVVQRGQRLVVAGEQFPSNIYPWQRLAEEAGATLVVVPPPDAPPRGARWNEQLLEAIDHDTALVALGPVHWADGTRFDLETIGARARDVDAAFVIDGTQAIGALPFDVATLQPDAVICAAYKWLLGPYSIGLAYYGPRFDGGVPLEENWITRRGSEHFGGLVHYADAYQPGAVRYDVGERSNFILVPMLVAALELLATWRPAAIQDYCAALTHDFVREVQAMGFWVEDEPWRAAHLFGLRVPPGVAMERLRVELRRRHVAVSERGNALRISPHLYNEAADFDALREALEAAR